jgi:hypothetical protein
LGAIQHLAGMKDSNIDLHCKYEAEKMDCLLEKLDQLLKLTERHLDLSERHFNMTRSMYFQVYAESEKARKSLETAEKEAKKQVSF